ncbi:MULTISPECIES: protein DA1 [unclassified Actinoplanes]|uniref:protein DA1 n=1 Tax=unclassified Actinoplanes TaxID=2626549 RepID=UPI000C07231C|nr:MULTISPECIES: protein DA1 [unclassified Actinoplanes]
MGLPRCAVCGRLMTLTGFVTPNGELICHRHAHEQPSTCCGLPADPTLAAERPLCPRCAATAVRTQQDVRRVLPPIAARLRALSIWTTKPVRVRLVPVAELQADWHGSGALLGGTVCVGSEVVDLMVVRDLPLVRFGAVVAHEVMHAYLVQHGFGELPPPVEEGLCELLAHAWLKGEPGAPAEWERRRIMDNPDPVYGNGFRAARQAALRVGGVSRMLAHVRRYGDLP